MNTETLKAFHVGEDYEGKQVITFAKTNAQARREGGNELNLTFEEVSFCRRAPWADQYAGQAFIPAKAYHDQGWWLYCNNCETELYEDAEDEDGNQLQIVYDGRHAYCDAECKEIRADQIADANAKGEAFKSAVIKARPDLNYTEFEIGWPRITMLAKFKFPGCKYGGSVRDQEGDGSLVWYIASADQEAWEAFHEGLSA
jgi:hypothetical protein